MNWESIGGWFDYMGLYDAVVDGAPSDRPSVFVEVGSFLGRSAAYLGQKIKESGKPIILHCIDCWDGRATCDDVGKMNDDIAREQGKPFADVFVGNMVACGLSDIVKPIQCLSHEGAAHFANGSVDFVFIDADHSREAVLADIRAWLPKMRPGGVLAGHDYCRDDVSGAVHELLGKDNIRVHHILDQNIPSWVYDVPK
jgi:predicted O-methyltransferase YrrM